MAKFEDIIQGNTLVFFDEVQECPEIVTAIKFLVEDRKSTRLNSSHILISRMPSSA